MTATDSAKLLLLVFIALLLVACGGGSSNDSNSGFTPAGIRVTANAQSSSVQSGSTVDISVRVTEANGAPIRDGTTVNASVSPAANGTIVGLNAAGGETGSSATTAGGNASFRFRATGPGGSVTVTFSVPDPNAPSRNVTASVGLNVTAPTFVDRITIEATRDVLPINAFNVDPFLGSPYMAEVTVTVRSSSGQLLSVPDGLSVSINPVGNTGGFSTLDDGETEDVNEFLVRLGQGPVDIVAGKATIFVHSLNFSGTTTLTVTAQDPDANNEIVSATKVFTITSTSPPLPNSVVVSPPTAPIYVQGSGGNTSGQFEVIVRDGIGQPVPDPVAGSASFNNVRIELLGEAAAGGARLNGINAAGQSVSGSSISTRTTNGITGGLLISGNGTGPALIRATADRADNNVDNGISDPVIGERTIFVSDGVLFDVEITQPFVRAIVINPFDPTVEMEVDQELGIVIPPNPDGTYSITVAAIATDRLGNPVLPGTSINFGLIDEPQATGLGDFLMSGFDGNPQEDGTLFTAPGGRFRTAGGGAGPGDAVVILSEDDPANRDLEGARVIASVNSETSLTVTRRFNRNDVTGSIVNSGNVLNYVIGRAADGNITADAVTNEIGVARTTLNYPVSRLGKFAVVWAQGNGAIVGGHARVVADAEFLRFAGIAPARLAVSPSIIPGNRTVPVTICVSDALFAPVQGISIGFGFQGLEGGSGSVDGTPSAGSVGSLTGANGCTVALVTTSGLLADLEDAKVVFSAAGQTAEVEIETGTLILSANPSAFFGAGGNTVLRLTDAGGNPVSGAQLAGTCEGSDGAIISAAPASGGTGVTNANGESTWTITALGLNQAGSAGSGTCTFTTASGEPEVEVTLQGVDLCEQNLSPPAPGCDPTPQFALTVQISGNVGASVSSSPPGILCSRLDGNPTPTTACMAQFDEGTTVTLQVRPTDDDPTSVSFSGDCVRGGDTVNSATASVLMNQVRTCNVAVN